MTDHGVTFDLSVCAHTDQFRYMHKTVFKNRFSDHTRPFRHQVQQSKLGLHIGRECRMRRGTYVNGFRTFTVHIQADPVFAGFNIGTGFAQFCQYRVQRIRLGVAADDLTAGDGCSDQEGPGFDTVRQDAIYTTTQTCNAFNGNTIGALTGDLRAQRIQEVRGIHDLRLAGGVLDDGGAFGQRRCGHDGDGSANAYFVHHDVGAFQTAIHGRLHIALFQLNFCAQLLKAKNVQVHRTRANGATARQRNLALSKTGHQRTQRPDGCTHGLHQIVRGGEVIHVAGVDPDGSVTLNLGTQLAEQFHGGINVFQLRYVLDLYRLFRKQCGEEDRQRGIFSAGNCDFALETRRPLNTKFVHVITLCMNSTVLRANHPQLKNRLVCDRVPTL